jgi:transposase
VSALGVDETAFTAATARRPTAFVTGIVNLSRDRRGPARLLDVVNGRSAASLVSWAAARDAGWRAGVWVAALDPYRGYAVRHEALQIRVGCKDPPPVRRSGSVKPRAA